MSWTRGKCGHTLGISWPGHWESNLRRDCYLRDILVWSACILVWLICGQLACLCAHFTTVITFSILWWSFVANVVGPPAVWP